MGLVQSLLVSIVFPVGGLWLVYIGWTFYRCRSPSHKLPYPPGPPEKDWLAGNLRDLPSSFQWNTYLEWGKKYGDLVHYRVYDKHTLIINSLEDAVELFEKRSTIFSDRPDIPMVNLMGWADFNLGLMHYGQGWRSNRRLFQKILKPESVSNYRQVQIRKAQDFLYSLLTTPEDFMQHNRTISGAIIMSIMYDHDVAPGKNDKFINLAEDAMSRLNQIDAQGNSLLDTFPILRFTPSWLPGAGFKRFALEAKRLLYEMRDVPFASVQKRIQEGEAPNCVAVELLETCKTDEEVELVAGVVGTAYGAGSDTTVSSMGTFFYAMCAYPEVQRKAQKEIDAVIGQSDRLVTLEDKSALVYIQALFREILRWQPVGPLGVSHASSSDDVYKGYFIPKGTMIIPNVWAMTHDPKRYPEPDTFNPDRFILENGELNDDDVQYSFGFGRRICPGRHLASASLWLTFAMVLQTFDLRPKRDQNGVEIPLNVKYGGGGQVNHPLPFECSITPRSREARQLILESVGKA